MDQLDLIWEFEKYSINMADYKDQHQQLLKRENEDLLLTKLTRLEKNIGKLEVNKKEAEKNLRAIEGDLDDERFILGEIDRELYDGSISDVKQLEHLSEKKEISKKKIDDAENIMLDLLGNLEEIEEKDLELKKELDGLVEDNNSIKTENDKAISEILSKIKAEEMSSLELEEKLDETSLKTYRDIKATKKKAVAEVKGETCRGCNLMVSAALLDNIKNKRAIYTCQNCGRILYLEK